MEAWLEDSGADGLDKVEVADFPLTTGRGVRAKCDLNKGDKILTIPAPCLWTIKRARNDELFGTVLKCVPRQMSVDETLALYILFVRSRPDHLPYKNLQKHIAALPQSYTASVFFEKNELAVLVGSSLHQLTANAQAQIENDYLTFQTLFQEHPTLFQEKRFSIEEYKWALCTIWSRGMDFVVDGEPVRLLAPFADMLNHSPDVQEQCHRLIKESGNLFVIASRDYKAGDQVFINYHYFPGRPDLSKLPNHRLLYLYGFVLPSNPDDSYELALQTGPGALRYAEKEKLWARAGLTAVSTIPLTVEEPLPSKILQYLRIQRLEYFESMTEQEADEQILHYLIAYFTETLAGFGSPREDLEERLGNGTYATGSNSWAAAHVSASEQRILELAKGKAAKLLGENAAAAQQAAMQRAEKMLAALRAGDDGEVDAPPPDRCVQCGKDGAAAKLMMCGKCKAVKYCGRHCQVVDRQKHKKVCSVKK
ncbi:Rubisco LS methyltransferase, substrate-binding domain protein [Cordyceps fumosorosea ARSEF 2679]|uniref:Rubisco LS methyltransferase, substrate-binding domain protein n=1 Tax=Cordyceps fumosorosea (strain ARSEF 2679) TaxID=1081104 RepID=A0A167LZ11_CORFA|nr:Rubisco LS methyltransferase, substrate-binding domain protein [Cordyceps fumosorosea ARSEF 2679]OAA53709.1 Rubisco LS methyltransferase, substrate-binding domain protein [Cordyceps fumosorosea ARSEF 2679]